MAVSDGTLPLAYVALLWEIGKHLQISFGAGKDKTMAEPEGEFLTLDEAASYLKAGKRTLYRFAARGKLPGFKLGATWRFRRSELDVPTSTTRHRRPRERTPSRAF